jgi:hypothetical protein
MSLNYKPPGPTAKAFMLSSSFFRGLRGPVGSGKSVCCCVEMFRRATQQAPGPDGKRKTRWAVIRNTNPQLKTTTIKTWLDWFPEDVWGKFNWSPPFTHHVRKGDIDMEVIFLALDKPEDVKKLLSLELTGVFINEAREVPKAIVDACTMRVGRFPSMKDGGPTWYGVIADTNAPDEDHWWPIMAGEAPVPDHLSREEALMMIKPDTYEFFTQPGGMVPVKDEEGIITSYQLNKRAENLHNLTPGYYPDIIKGKGKNWIAVYVLNELGSLSDGKPVYNDFDEATHVAKEPLIAAPGIPIVIGIDFGLTPSAIYCQNVRGRWLVLRELVAQDMGAAKFADLLKRDMAQNFPGVPMERFQIWGDPAGDYRAQTDETTPFQVLRTAGIKARAAPTNDPSLRIDAVTAPLTRMAEGKPAFLLDPSCVMLRRGFAGGYCYKRMQVSGAERYDDRPDKNKYSHPHDALQYALCGGGESRKLLVGDTSNAKPVVARKSFDVLGWRQTSRRRQTSPL